MSAVRPPGGQLYACRKAFPEGAVFAGTPRRYPNEVSRLPSPLTAVATTTADVDDPAVLSDLSGLVRPAHSASSADMASVSSSSGRLSGRPTPPATHRPRLSLTDTRHLALGDHPLAPQGLSHQVRYLRRQLSIHLSFIGLLVTHRQQSFAALALTLRGVQQAREVAPSSRPASGCWQQRIVPVRTGIPTARDPDYPLRKSEMVPKSGAVVRLQYSAGDVLADTLRDAA